MTKTTTHFTPSRATRNGINKAKHSFAVPLPIPTRSAVGAIQSGIDSTHPRLSLPRPYYEQPGLAGRMPEQRRMGLIIHPDGEIAAELTESDGISVAEVDLRMQFDSWIGSDFRNRYWGERRPHLYSRLTDGL